MARSQSQHAYRGTVGIHDWPAQAPPPGRSLPLPEYSEESGLESVWLGRPVATFFAHLVRLMSEVGLHGSNAVMAMEGSPRGRRVEDSVESYQGSMVQRESLAALRILKVLSPGQRAHQPGPTQAMTRQLL